MCRRREAQNSDRGPNRGDPACEEDRQNEARADEHRV